MINIESLLSGSGGGLLVAVATFFGFHRRLNSHKEALLFLQETKVDKDVFAANLKMNENMYEEVKYIRARVDDLVNGRK